MMQYLPSLAGVAIISFLLTRMLIPLSHFMGLLDRPDNRKAHTGSIPLIGGISIYLSVLFCAVLFLNLPEHFIGIALICGLVTFLGALDDRYPVHPNYRLLMQLDSGRYHSHCRRRLPARSGQSNRLWCHQPWLTRHTVYRSNHHRPLQCLQYGRWHRWT